MARDPWCRGPCGGANPSRIADHVRPVKDGGSFWDPANIVGICRRCHALKSRLEQGERGELAKGRQVKSVVPGCDPATGLPNDPSHHWYKGR